MHKDDAGKPRPSLVPWDGIWPVLQVAEFGASKYGPHTWRAVPDALDRYTHALQRHALELLCDPTAIDADSGLPHVAHLAWNCLAVLALRSATGGGQ